MADKMDAAVEFKNVDIIFGENAAQAVTLLDQGGTRETIHEETGSVIGAAGANLTVSRGEICVLMGLSGSGKSTLLRAVNGLNKVTRGEVLVQDADRMVDVAACDEDTLRHMRSERIAMVFQQFALLPWRTVAENVGLGLELRGTAPDEIERIVKEKLELVHLDQWADKFAHELSGGMQQRVGLARAFATDADILLMDEPFSALDPLIRTHLQDELLELQRALYMEEAQELSDHIAIMDGGRIVQYGKPEEIILNPANDYVRDFVSHVNPLNVLSGEAIMTSIQGQTGEIKMDAQGHVILHLTQDGTAGKVTINGQDAEIIAAETASENTAALNICTAPSQVCFRDVIACRQKTGNPIILIEEDKVVGYIGDDEILNALVR